MNKFVFIAIFILNLITRASAQTISGAEMYSSYQGDNKFQVDLILYTSCFDAVPGNASIKAKCLSSGSVLSTKTVAMPTATEITNVCQSQCTRCTKPTCATNGIRKYRYQTIIDLSSAGSCCNIIFYYEQGKRTSLISTGPASTNFYIETFVNRCIAGDEGLLPLIEPEFLAVKGNNYSQALTIYNSTFLKDSLVYELTSPLTSNRNPVSFSGQYSFDKPCYFWGFPNKNLAYPRGLQFTGDYGQLTFRPMNAEVAVVTVKIKQFSNGQLYKEFMREWIVQSLNQTIQNPPQVILPSSVKICNWSGSIVNIKANDIDGDSVVFVHPFTVVSKDYSNPAKPEQQVVISPQFDVSQGKTIPYVIRVKDNKCPVPGSSTVVFPVKIINGMRADISVIDSSCGLYGFNLINIKGNYDSLHWYGDGNLNSVMKNFSHRFYLSNHDFNFKMEMKKLNGCLFVQTDKVKTGGKVSYAVSAGSDDTICFNSGKHLLTGMPDDETGIWKGLGTEKSDKKYYFNSSNESLIKNKWYQLIFSYKNIDNCENSDTANYYLLETSKPDAGDDLELCKNAEEIVLKALPTGGKWDGTGIINNKFRPDSVDVGIYQIVYGISTHGKCNNYDTLLIRVLPIPEVNFKVDPPNGNIPLNVNFKDSTIISEGFLEDYLWNFGDGNISPVKGSVNHIYTDPGDYSVVLIVKSEKGCSGVKIVPHAVGAWKVDIKEKQFPSIYFYQLKDQQKYCLENLNTNSKIHYEIFEYSGKRSDFGSIQIGAKHYFDANSYNSGLYLLKITDESGKIIFFKIIF